MSEAYFNQVRLLLRVLPLVAQEKIFALKGGTASISARRSKLRPIRSCAGMFLRLAW